MNPDEHPVIARTRTSWWQRAGYAIVVLAVGAGFAGLGLALSAKEETSKTAEQIKVSRPCFDTRPGPKVDLSAGCRAMVDNLNFFCASHRRYCLESERRAVKKAQNVAADRNIGLEAAGGGGGSKGNGPQSPRTPSPPSGGGGGNNPQPKPRSPSQPGAGGQTTPPAGGPDGKPTVTVPDVRDTVKDVAPELCSIQTPLGPVVKLCP